MQLQSFFPQDDAGNLLTGGTATVYLKGTQTLATGLADVAGNPVANPVPAAASGRVQFRAPMGDYDVLLEAGAFSLQVEASFMEAGDLMPSVSDMQALRELDAVPESGIIYLKCHTTTGDGGHGEFRWEEGAAPGTYVDNNGTIIVPTGGDGSAAWVRELQGFVTPQMFGAVADFVPDVTDAIKAAVATGFDVFLPIGIYKISSTITLRADQTLYGSGRLSILKLRDMSEGELINMIRPGLEGCVIRDLCIDGNRNGDRTGTREGVGVRATQSARKFKVLNCLIRNCKSDGVYGNLTDVDSDIYVQNCRFENNGRQGVAFVQAGKVRVLGNTFIDNTINFEAQDNESTHCRDVVISENIIDLDEGSPYPHAIFIKFGEATADSGKWLISKNISRGGQYKVDGRFLPVDLVIDGCQIYGARGNGIELTRAPDVKITNTTVDGAAASGISVSRSDRVSILGNTLRNNASRGLRYPATLNTPSDETIVLGNRITGNGSYGIETFDYRSSGLGASCTGVFQSNIFRDNASGSIYSPSFGGNGGLYGRVILRDNIGPDLPTNEGATVSDTWEPGEIASLASASRTVTVTQSQVGDYVVVAPPYDVAGCLVWAQVTAADTVVIAVYNPTGSTVTLASGDWKVRVTKSQ